MKNIKEYALKRPFIFGLFMIFLFSLLSTLTYPVHFLFPETTSGQLLGDALGKILIFLVFLFITWRFGWLQRAGFAQVGKPLAWVVLLPILVYKILSWVYAFTGDLIFPPLKLGLASSHLALQLGTSLVEETMVRGLVLTAMILAWGETKSGQFKAAALSSLYFGMIHLFNLISRPSGTVLLQAVILSLPGLFYAAFLLRYKTIWPGVILHWLLNATVNIKLIGVENYQETLSNWLIAGAAILPLALLSLYWVWKLSVKEQTELIPEPAPAVT